MSPLRHIVHAAVEIILLPEHLIASRARSCHRLRRPSIISIGRRLIIVTLLHRLVTILNLHHVTAFYSSLVVTADDDIVISILKLIN